MDITKVVSMAICALFIIILTKKINSDHAFLLSCFVNTTICLFSFGILIPVFDYIKELCQSQSTKDLCTVLFKSAGICLLCSFASELCRDSNEASLASKIEFAGKCTLITYCLPLIKMVFGYAKTFIG